MDTQKSVLDDLGEEVTGIVAPVSLCMAVTVLLVRLLNPEGVSSANTVLIASIAYQEQSTDSPGKKLGGALLNALIFVGVVAGMTVVLFLLFKYKCYKFIFAYMGFAVFNIFFFITGALFIQVMQVIGLHIDAFSLAYGLFNFSVIGTLGLLFVPIPLLAKQVYLIWVGIIVAYIFTFIPEWTAWVLLVLMAVYDIIAVLMPGGPLKALVELAVERQQELPALIYEARPAGGRPYVRGWGRRNAADAAAAAGGEQQQPPASAGGAAGAPGSVSRPVAEAASAPVSHEMRRNGGGAGGAGGGGEMGSSRQVSVSAAAAAAGGGSGGGAGGSGGGAGGAAQQQQQQRAGGAAGAGGWSPAAPMAVPLEETPVEVLGSFSDSAYIPQQLRLLHQQPHNRRFSMMSMASAVTVGSAIPGGVSRGPQPIGEGLEAGSGGSSSGGGAGEWLPLPAGVQNGGGGGGGLLQRGRQQQQSLLGGLLSYGGGGAAAVSGRSSPQSHSSQEPLLGGAGARGPAAGAMLEQEMVAPREHAAAAKGGRASASTGAGAGAVAEGAVEQRYPEPRLAAPGPGPGQAQGQGQGRPPVSPTMGVRAVAPAFDAERLAEAVGRRRTQDSEGELNSAPSHSHPQQQPQPQQHPQQPQQFVGSAALVPTALPAHPPAQPHPVVVGASSGGGGGNAGGRDGGEGGGGEGQQEVDLPDAIKLGLGDFIFYSMLVGRAAMYDFMTVFSAYVAIIAGLGLTLLCLAVFQKALPALPFSIALGVAFYFLTRLTLEPFLVPLSANLAFF